MTDQTDTEVLEYIRQKLYVDWEDIKKGFDELLVDLNYWMDRTNLLERRLAQYEKVRISFPTQEESEELAKQGKLFTEGI